MIKIVKEINEKLVEIESDKGWYLDIGGDVAKQFQLDRDCMQYVEELTSEKAKERMEYYASIGN